MMRCEPAIARISTCRDRARWRSRDDRLASCDTLEKVLSPPALQIQQLACGGCGWHRLMARVALLRLARAGDARRCFAVLSVAVMRHSAAQSWLGRSNINLIFFVASPAFRVAAYHRVRFGLGPRYLALTTRTSVMVLVAHGRGHDHLSAVGAAVRVLAF